LKSRIIDFKGKAAEEHIFETSVTLSRPARRNVKDKRFSVPVAPLTLRLVIAKVIDPKTRKELARWYLLSNVDQDVDSPRLRYGITTASGSRVILSCSRATGRRSNTGSKRAVWQS
jgi:hypothetical protein